MFSEGTEDGIVAIVAATVFIGKRGEGIGRRKLGLAKEACL
jgi:hypothetical protein